MNKKLLYTSILLLSALFVDAQSSGLPDLIPPAVTPPQERMLPYADKYKSSSIDSEHIRKYKTLEEAGKEFTDWVNSPSNSNSNINGNATLENSDNHNSGTSNSLVSGPASNDVKYQTKSFDWEKSNASRYVNSPCYKILGFNPEGGEEQERRYRECEESKLHDNSSIFLYGVAGFLVLVGLFVWVNYDSFKKKTKLSSNIEDARKLSKSADASLNVSAYTSENLYESNRHSYQEKHPVSTDLTQVQKNKRDILTTTLFGNQHKNSGLVQLIDIAKEQKKRIRISNLTPFVFNQQGEDKVSFNSQEILIDFSKQQIHLSGEICIVLACDPDVLINSYEKLNDVDVLNLSPKEYETIISASLIYSNEKIILAEVDFGMYVKFDNKNTWKIELS